MILNKLKSGSATNTDTAYNYNYIQALQQGQTNIKVIIRIWLNGGSGKLKILSFVETKLFGMYINLSLFVLFLKMTHYIYYIFFRILKPLNVL